MIIAKGKPVDYYCLVVSPFNGVMFLSLEPETTAQMIAGFGEQFEHMCVHHPEKVVQEMFAA